MSESRALATPDPSSTSEGFVALAASSVSAAIVLFKLDLSDARQAALVTLIGIIYTAFTLLHAAYVRGQRAKAGGPTP